MSAKRHPDDAVLAAVPEVARFAYLDSGSFKNVYLATLASGAEEVLKIVNLPQDLTSDEAKALHQQELGRVQREIAILAQGVSPYVVHLGTVVPGIRNIAGESCFVYSEEKLSGICLRKQIQSTTSHPDEAEVKLLLRCLVQGIQALWTQAHTVHRDIKPENVFSTGLTGRPYVMLDLGIAYIVNEPGLTLRPDCVPHTPLYLAPEMVDANFRDSLSYRADLYAAGITAFEFATCGIHPLARQGETLHKTYYRILNQEPTPLRTLRPDLSIPLCTLVDQLLKKKPALRPGNLNLILQQLA